MNTKSDIFFSTGGIASSGFFVYSGYSYGFQGQEKDDEVKGEGNSINYKYRMHDPRIGRFFAVDPLTAKYPHYTPYSFSGNKVIHAVELEGLEEAVINNSISDNNGNSFKAEIKTVHISELTGQYAAIMYSLLNTGMIDDKTQVHFNAKNMNTQYGKKEHGLFLGYEVSFMMGSEVMRFDYNYQVGSVHVEGSSPMDYALAMIGTGAYSYLFRTTYMKTWMNTAVKQMFKQFYGTTRGRLIEGLAAQTKYKGWTWLDNVSSNYPTFDFMKGNIYSSFKTWKSNTFSLSSYKGYVDKIKSKIDDGFTFKKKPYNPSAGVLDILVPEGSVDDFIKEGGKHYDNYQKLVKYGNENGVTVKVGSKL